MAAIKISQLPELTLSSDVTQTDLLHIINKDQTSIEYPTGTNRSIKASTLANGLGRILTTIPPIIQTALDAKLNTSAYDPTGIKVATPVRAASTVTLTLSGINNGSSIDGVTLATGDRVLIKNQSTATQNGIYVVNASGGLTRATDFAIGTDVNGYFVLVSAGTTQNGSGWVVTSNPAVIGTNNITITQFSSALGTVTKQSIGLGNVNDTSDVGKPISTLTQAALDTKQATITGAASTITTSFLTASRALVSDGDGRVAASTITSIELGRLSGVSADIQSQLNAKSPNNNPAFTGTVTLPTTTTVGGRAIDLIPSGAVMAFAMNSAPAGWLIANGDTIPNGTGTVQGKTENFSTLYGLLGATHGALGKLPDLRGYFVRGAGTNGDGTFSGAFGAKQADELKAHTHTLFGANNITGAGLQISRMADNMSNYQTESFGGSETRPKNIAMLYCIKI